MSDNSKGRTKPPDRARLRALRQSEERFRQVAEALPQFVWVSRPDGSLEYVNGRWFDYSGLDLSASADNRQLAAAIHPDDRSRIFEYWRRCVRDGTSFEMETRLRRRDGAFRWFLVRTMPLHDESGRISRWFGSSTDINEQKRSAQNARFLVELAEVIRLADDPDALLWHAVQMTGEYVQAVRCFFAEVDDAADVWLLHRDFRISPDLHSLAGQYPLADAPPRMIEALRAGRVVRVENTATDPVTSAFHEPIYEPLGVHSLVAIPLLRQGRWTRTFTVFYGEARQFAPEEVAFLETIAERTWNAVERARAEQRLRRLNQTLEQRVAQRTAALGRSEALLRRMASTLTLAEQDERQRLSRVLHDDLQQQLYGIQMKLSFAREEIAAGDTTAAQASIVEAEDWLEQGVEITRRLTVDLSPPVLKSEGLADMLAWLVPQMEELHGLQVTLRAEDPIVIAGGDVRVLLFQIVRELLFNVVKHAGVQRATVALRREGDHLLVTVGDEGRGFDAGLVSSPPADKGGLGLFNARERLGLFGGKMEIDATPGGGARVTLRVPLSSVQERIRP